MRHLFAILLALSFYFSATHPKPHFRLLSPLPMEIENFWYQAPGRHFDPSFPCDNQKASNHGNKIMYRKVTPLNNIQAYDNLWLDFLQQQQQQ